MAYDIHLQGLKKVFASGIHHPLVSDSIMRRICEAKMCFACVAEQDARSFCLCEIWHGGTPPGWEQGMALCLWGRRRHR